GAALLEDTPVPILSGIKLTGKAGPYDIGLIDVQTRASEGVDAKNFAVMRVKRTVLQQSSLGGIFTNGNPADPSAARTYGGDVRLATSHFIGTKQPVYFDAFALKSNNKASSTQPRANDDNSFGLGFNSPSDLLSLSANWK